MIRPITCVTFVLACGSGLYLYQTKHQVRQLDSQIEQVVHQTEQVREQIRVLHAEWTLLDQPDRLQTLAGQFLNLQPTKPSQFVSASDLDARLPAPLPPNSPSAQSPSDEDGATALPAPPPPLPNPPVAEKKDGSAIAIAAAAPARMVEHPASHQAEPPRASSEPHEAARQTPTLAVARPALSPHPQFAVVRPQPPLRHLPPPRPLSRYATPHNPTNPVLTAAATPHYPGESAYGGSALGMAHGAPPPPAPTAWTNWNR